MGTTMFKHYYKSVSYYLPKIHEDYRKAIVDKIHLALELSKGQLVLEVPTLEEAYKHYGKAVYCVQLTKEINHRLMKAWGGYSVLEPWADEIWKLFELATKAESLWKEMINSLIYHQSHPEK